MGLPVSKIGGLSPDLFLAPISFLPLSLSPSHSLSFSLSLSLCFLLLFFTLALTLFVNPDPAWCPRPPCRSLSLSRGLRHASLPVGLIRSPIRARANHTTARRLSFQQPRHVLSLLQRSVPPWSPYPSFNERSTWLPDLQASTGWSRHQRIKISKCHLSVVSAKSSRLDAGYEQLVLSHPQTNTYSSGDPFHSRSCCSLLSVHFRLG